MITIKDIARLANVSIGTVDRVIHNRGGVSEKTKETVQRILKENNFKINAIARSLALKKTITIAVLLPKYDGWNMFWKGPFMGVSKASAEVENLGIKVQIYLFDQFDKNSFLNEFNAIVDSGIKFDACIFTPIFLNETKHIVRVLGEKEIPYMFLNMDIEGCNNISYIGQDAFKSGYLGAKLMYLCTGNSATYLIPNFESQAQNNSLVFSRIKGFKSFFEENKLACKSELISIPEAADLKSVKNQLINVISGNSTIEGIFVPSSRVSVISDAIDGAEFKNLKLIGFDTTEENTNCLKEDKVTFLISQKSFNQGFQAVHIMANYLVQNELPSKKIFSPIEIITKENLEFSQRTKIEYNLEVEGKN